jgi:hypothetical protein
MSTIIQIKRSANVTAPSTSDLVVGELAYSQDKANDGVGARLYIESVDSSNNEVVHIVGGKYYTDKVDGASSANTANALVQRDASGNFSANVITANTLVGNIVGTVTGQAQSANIANFANALTTPRNITLAGDVTGTVSFDGTSDVTITTTANVNSVALGTDTTGDYVANVLAGTGIEVSNQGGETATPTVALTNTGVAANTYGGSGTIPVFTVDAQGRITSAANSATAVFVTADSITTFTNKTYDVSVGANNKFSIQGNQITGYSGSGAVVVLDTMPTLYGFNIGNSDLNLDGGTGTYYWSGQSGVAQTGDLKAGFYATSPTANNSLFTFGVNGSNYMSVGIEGSLFVGTALPTNNGGLNSSYAGWLVVQSGGKFGGDIDTLGGLNLTDATNGKITFSDNSVQRTAYTSNHLTTANVVEVNNLYFTNARARASLTSGNAIAYDTATGNITLLPSGVTATTYGGTTSIPVFTVDQFGRITSASNTTISTSFTIKGGDNNTDTFNTGDQLIIDGQDGIATSLTSEGSNTTISITLNTTGISAGSYGTAGKVPTFTVDSYGRLSAASNVDILVNLVGDTGTDSLNLATETLAVKGGTGVSTSLSGNTFTINNDGVTALASGGYGLTVSSSTGSVTVTNTGVTRLLSGGHGISLDTNNGNVTVTNNGVTSVTGTVNEINVSGSTGNITIGLPDDVTIARDLTVSGNLYVTGNVVALPVENLVVEDSLIQLANNNILADTIDIGFYGSYNNDGGTHEHAGLFRDASDGKFRLFQGLQGQDNLTSTINIAGTGYEIATLVADLVASNANVSTALSFGNEKNQIVPLSSSILEVRGGLGDASGALSLAAGNYPTSYSKIYLESGKKITMQADEAYFTLFNDGSTKVITMNTTHTAAVSNATGALRVAGGVGITGNVYADYFNGKVDGGTY